MGLLLAVPRLGHMLRHQGLCISCSAAWGPASPTLDAAALLIRFSSLSLPQQGHPLPDHLPHFIAPAPAQNLWGGGDLSVPSTRITMSEAHFSCPYVWGIAAKGTQDSLASSSGFMDD